MLKQNKCDGLTHRICFYNIDTLYSVICTLFLCYIHIHQWNNNKYIKHGKHEHSTKGTYCKRHCQGIEEREGMQQDKRNCQQEPHLKFRYPVQHNSNRCNRQGNKEHKVLVYCNKQQQAQEHH